MKRHILPRASLLLLLMLPMLSAEDRYIVRVPSSVIHDVAGRHGLKVLQSLQGKDLYVVAPVAAASTSQVLNQLAADPAVLNAELDAALSLPERSSSAPIAATPAPILNALANRTVLNYYSSQAWGAYVNQPAAAITRLAGAHTIATGAGTVAFLDTGVDFSNPVLAGSLVQGFDFTRNISGGSEMADVDQSTTAILDQSTTAILDNTAVAVLNQSTTAILDQSTTAILDRSKLPAAFGHGTMVAGIIHLVAPTSRLMPVKVFSGDGTSSISKIVAGIYYAVDNGAKVISMSFSAPQSSQELMRAITYANSRRVICVASAGNDGKDILVYPAGYKQVIGVASTNDRDVRSAFSNYGSVASMAAPGEGVITTFPGNHYAAVWGTSFSAPMVSGGAALLAQIDGNTNEAQAGHALSQAVDVGQELGAGRIDLFQACQYAARGGN